LSLRQRYLALLTHLAPAGVVGVSALLGAAAPGAASEPPPGAQPMVTEKEAVSERLAAVREAVSAIDTQKEDAAKAEGRLAWGNWGYRGGWGGYGYRGGWGGWPNWHNWGNWFRNW
jgi:hypothetical protein